MIDLNKYSTEFDKNKMLPTGGYAKTDPVAAGAPGIDPRKQAQTSADRQRIVQGYNRSALGSQRGVLRAKRYEPPQDGVGDSDSGGLTSSSRQALNASSHNVGLRSSKESGAPGTTPKGSFQEPPSRGYNPYA